MKEIISVRNLKKYFGEVRAVDDLSFGVREGELFAFLGLNGAGKSTTINVICGVLKKDSGEVLVDGTDADGDASAVKSKIGVVFQESVLDRELSVSDNLRFRAALYGITGRAFAARLGELSGLLDLEGLLKRPLGKLSGGQRRRIDIARALLHKPKILILDEPTTGLDPQTRRMVWNCIGRLRRETGLTVFLTTHYMEEAAEADYVVILDGGRVAASDTPVGLKNAYASDFIRVYEKTPALAELIAREGLAAEERRDYTLIEVPSVAEAKRLLLTCPDAFPDFEVEKGKMDDVFLKVTGKRLEGGKDA